MRILAHVAAVLALALGLAPAHAADYPKAYPIHWVVPYAAGGGSDIVARNLQEVMSKALGQTVVIDNKPGAATAIGAEYVAHAKPDGYTILMTSTAISVNPALFKNLPYDPIKDFIPISELVNAPNVLVVKPDSGINTIADLVARVKASPGTFSYGSPGAGTKSHLTGEQLKLRAGIDMVHVPFRGAGPAAQAVLANQLQVASVALAAAEPLIKSGELRALAVTGEKRWFSLPDVPTMIESGYPGFVSDTFNALFVPAGTPPEIVDAIVKSSQAAMRRPEALEAARKAGFEVVAGTPDQLARRVAAEIESVRELVAKAGIKTEN